MYEPLRRLPANPRIEILFSIYYIYCTSSLRFIEAPESKAARNALAMHFQSSPNPFLRLSLDHVFDQLHDGIDLRPPNRPLLDVLHLLVFSDQYKDGGVVAIA